MSDALQKSLGDRVRALRTAAGKSQETFAAMANIDRATFGKLERGTINASLVTMARVAGALGIDLATLLEQVEFDPADIAALPRSARGPRPMDGDR